MINKCFVNNFELHATKWLLRQGLYNGTVLCETVTKIICLHSFASGLGYLTDNKETEFHYKLYEQLIFEIIILTLE